MDAAGKRRASSYSVEKWGLRRALWNGCLRLYRERQEAGYPVEEPHVMFARAQEPFQDQIRAEIAADELAAQQAPEPEPRTVETVTVEASRTRPTRRFSPEAELANEEERLRQLEDALFG
jgi:hypothetical protein